MMSSLFDVTHLGTYFTIISTFIAAFSAFIAYRTYVGSNPKFIPKEKRTSLVKKILQITAYVLISNVFISYVFFMGGLKQIERLILKRGEIVVPPTKPTQTLSSSGTTSLQKRSFQFITDYFSHGGDQTPDALRYFTPLYAEEVKYGDKIMSRSALMNDKEKYVLNKWPQRSYSIKPNSLQIDCDTINEICTVTGIVDWDYRTRYGSSAFSDTISFQNYSPVITAESGKTLERYDRQ